MKTPITASTTREGLVSFRWGFKRITAYPFTASHHRCFICVPGLSCRSHLIGVCTTKLNYPLVSPHHFQHFKELLFGRRNPYVFQTPGLTDGVPTPRKFGKALHITRTAANMEIARKPPVCLNLSPPLYSRRCRDQGGLRQFLGVSKNLLCLYLTLFGMRMHTVTHLKFLAILFLASPCHHLLANTLLFAAFGF